MSDFIITTFVANEARCSTSHTSELLTNHVTELSLVVQEIPAFDVLGVTNETGNTAQLQSFCGRWRMLPPISK
jgi:hypothetical protein